MKHRLHAELELPLPVERVFSFFADARNLQRITPDNLGFEILTPEPITMCPGTLIDYRLRISGFPMRWRTRIPVWNPPHHFVDEQLAGPYKSWVHHHHFESFDGGTRIIDDVTYELPLTPLGDLAYPLIRRRVEAIFSYRNTAIPALLLADTEA
ncbi:SRPBCC family protein [Ruficoccus amylovorans]|uniref:SRPBCC family protein n=1 Tax=Ruficoccus amylovorans TaxID=1804625 RepID=A0A842HF71_9BACT|nr:SRPBCC family protein [Ruficoccus amylovorans]MBC2595072.1 SRPBCC family protein [Ruficoccus amylovorans]